MQQTGAEASGHKDGAAVRSAKMATSGSSSSGASGGGGANDGCSIPVTLDSLTFSARQDMRLNEMEKRVQEEIKKKKKDWNREVEKMREEFLELYPSDKVWGSEELLSDPLIIKRRGSTDVLDSKRMKTMIMEYPDTGNRRFKLRFNVKEYDPKSVRLTCDNEKITVVACKPEETPKGEKVGMGYVRKIEKPKNIDASKIKSFQTCDGILIVDAPLPPHSLNLRKISHSPTHSSQGSHISSRSRSPSDSPRTPGLLQQKLGLPVFIDTTCGRRRMSLLVEVGTVFKPKDITVQILKENRIQVKCKHEERTSERFSKSRFSKEYELPEKIETYSLRAGRCSDGKLLIGAIGKGGLDGMTRQEAGEWVMEELGISSVDATANSVPCNVLDLACFPPVNIAASASNSS